MKKSSKIYRFFYYKRFLLSFVLVIPYFVFAQTNEKTKAKEMNQLKQINNDYDKGRTEKKRANFLNETKKQREGRGNIKGKAKGQKETEYINNTVDQRKFDGNTPKPQSTKSLAKEIKKNSSGDIKAGTPQEREYKQVKNSVDSRSFQGNTKVVESQYKKQNTKDMGNYSGDKKYITKGEKEAAYISRSVGERQFTGNLKTDNLSHLSKKESNKKEMQKYATGDLKYMTKGEKQDAYIDRTKDQREFSGNIKEGNLAHLEKRKEIKREMERYKGNVNASNYAHLQKREENKKEMEKYATGDLKYLTKEQKDKAYQKRTQEMRSYQGNIDVGNLAHLIKRAEIKKDMERYSTGDIDLRDIEKRAQQRREKAKKVASYSGSIRTKDLENWRKSIRKKEKDIANFQGNIRVEKRKKGQHPSAVYRGGKIANSYTQKEKMRKKMLKKYGRKGDIDMPAHLKDQPKKAKYNRDESEIWW